MSKASVGAKVGTLIVGAIKGKKSAAATAATYAKAKASKAAVKAIPKTKLAEPSKASVKVKPAAKQKPNKPDAAKTQFKNDSSRTRASGRAMKEYEKIVIRHGERPTDPSFGSKLGERVALNTKLKRKPNLPSKPAAIKKDATKENFYERIRNPIKINSAKPTKGSSDNFVEVPVKDSKYGEGPGVFVSRSVAARKPTRKPTRNPENPPKGTVVIKSSSPSYLRKKAIPMNKPVVKKTARKFAPPKKKK